MKVLIAFIAGLVFGSGLLLSGMSSPDKVFAFLDFSGSCDPSLAFVMGGAVATAAPLFRLARERQQPLAGLAYDQPDTKRIDGKLLGGAVLFGLGWVWRAYALVLRLLISFWHPWRPCHLSWR